MGGAQAATREQGEQACKEYYKTSQDIDESKNGDTFDAVLKRTLSLLDAFRMRHSPFSGSASCCLTHESPTARRRGSCERDREIAQCQ